jgi:hypothetical protein
MPLLSLKMEATYSFETFVYNQNTTWGTTHKIKILVKTKSCSTDKD